VIKIKNILAYVVLILIGISSINLRYTTVEASDLNLTDVRESDWFKSNIEFLIDKGIVNGYTDGTFKPNNTVTKAQFVKMVITAMGHNELQNGGDYWASPYIKKAMFLNILSSKEVIPEEFEAPIIRADMAIIISKALQEEYADNLDEYASLLKDYESIKDIYKESVLKTYSKGIIGGYSDGEFKANNSLTRAEASTVIVRMIDTSKRVQVETIFSEEDMKILQDYQINKDMYKTGYTGLTKSFGQVSTERLGEYITDLCIDTAKTYVEKVKYGVNYSELKENDKEWRTYYIESMGTTDVLDNNEKYSYEEYQDKLIKQYIDDETISEAQFMTNNDLVYITDTGTVAVRGILKYTYLNTLDANIEKFVTVKEYVEIEIRSNANAEFMVNKIIKMN